MHFAYKVRLYTQNKARRVLEDVLDVRAHDRRPKVPPPVAQAGRASTGVEREAGAQAAA